MENKLWHSMPLKKIFAELKSNEKGLSEKDCEIKLKKFGYNSLPSGKKLTKVKILINQLASPLVYVLIAAALISLILGDYVDMSIILFAIVINTTLGFYQENKAGNSINYLKKLVNLKSKVLRDGNIKEIDSKNIVPGDILILEAGDKIPADARLFSIDGLLVNESALTGESIPSEKKLGTLTKGETLAERDNMVYSGTVIESGRGRAIACNTGIKTEIGKITQLVEETDEGKTPLQQQLATFSSRLTYMVIAASFAIIIIGKLQGRTIFGFGESAREGLLNTAAALAVAVIPEGMLVAITAILAIGMQAILKEKALVRKLVAAETLGSVSVICTDKTGTLTEGKMQVSKIVSTEKEKEINKTKYESAAKLKDHDLIVKISLLCNNSSIENPDEELKSWKVLGNPTESALLLGAMQAGVPAKDIKEAQPRLQEIPFDSSWKYMATLNKLNNSKNVVYVKGAPEKIFEMSSKIRINGRKSKLTEAKLIEMKDRYEKLTNQGLRVLAFGYKQISSSKTTQLKDELNDIIFIGFIALKDPLRAEAKETLRLAKKAGIRSVIITGDHKLTAKAIVSELGMKVKDSQIIEGKELDQMDDNQFDKEFKKFVIYARVEPKHKLRIIKAWKNAGEVVAMTGDGVNDAPALKAADIGIALGSGSDVAKETADIILIDNNFKTIVSAIERGRVIFDNIKKVVLYLLADSFSELILITGALIMALPLPILPAQIIWINLIADSFPSFALTFEPKENDVMKFKPRKKGAKILDKEMKVLIFAIGIITDIVLLILFYILLKFGNTDIEHIRTMIFTALSIDSLLYLFSCRSLRSSVLTKNPFSNKFLVLSVVIGFILQIIVVYQPHLQKIFQTVPLSMQEWVLIIALALIKVFAIEMTKHHFIVKDKTKRKAIAVA